MLACVMMPARCAVVRRVHQPSRLIVATTLISGYFFSSAMDALVLVVSGPVPAMPRATTTSSCRWRARHFRGQPRAVVGEQVVGAVLVRRRSDRVEYHGDNR